MIMQINKNSFHYKWWRLTYKVWGIPDHNIPWHSNLCSYVQRIFWITLFTSALYLFLGGTLLFVLVSAAIGVWHHPLIALAIVGGIALALAVLFGCSIYSNSETKEVVDTWVEAKTKGICPLIEFTGDSSNKGLNTPPNEDTTDVK
jgi:hypothetical protein